MTTIYDLSNISLYRVRMDQNDYRWIAVTKDDAETIELCRAVVRLEREGHIVLDVFKVNPNGISTAMNLRDFEEFRQAEKELETKTVDTKNTSVTPSSWMTKTNDILSQAEWLLNL